MDDPDVLETIRRACQIVGTTPPPQPIQYDGGIHRYFCPVNDKPGERNAWYKACDNGDGYGGTVGHWRLGVSQNWNSRSRTEFTPEQKAEYVRKMAAQRQREDQERQERYAQARTAARRIWDAAKPAAPSHSYLVKKSVGVHGIKQSGNSLLIPLRNAAGLLTSIQFIKPDGSKKFLSGGEITGSYHAIGGAPAGSILIAEGYATACTVFEATGEPTACAFNAGNLLSVSLAIRSKFPTITIIIAADSDPVGISKAESAAAAVAGYVIYPDFSEVA